MKPRRNVKISAPVEKLVPGKSAKGRPRKTNILKVPTVITISVPGKTGVLDVPDISDSERKVDLKTKIALANEVARSQLSNENIEARIEPPPIRKRGRRKRDTTQCSINSSTTRSAEVKVAETKPAQATAKKSNKRMPAQTLVTQRIVTRKRKAESIENQSDIKKQKEHKINLSEPLILKEEPLDENVPLNDDVVVKNIDDKPNSDLVNQPMVTIPTKKKICRRKSNNSKPPAKMLNTKFRKPRINRTKSCNNAPKSQSPILNSSVIKRTPNVKNCNIERVDICKISPTNSISNLSWTHDISSTTTCITVSSKDYVCFNNKIPIIKLNNINKKIAVTPPNIEGKTVNRNDATSSNIETSCDQSLPVVDRNNINDYDHLNLSHSSHNSTVMQNEHDKTVSNKQAHARAAENLLRALEKIDMEFINWIHEPEYVSPDLNKLKEKLFDILTSEFCAITYCRSLQELSVNVNSDYNYVKKSVEKNTPEIETVDMSVNSEKTGNTRIENDALNISNVSTKLGENDSVQKLGIINKDETNTFANERIKNKNENENVEIRRDFIKPSTSGVVLSKVANRNPHTSDSEDSLNGDDLPANAKVRTFTSHDPHDDDDALSLYAESITGLESAKLNVSMEDRQNVTVQKRMEEYIPEPVQKLSPNYTYRPTKIAEQVKNSIVKTVCEKQNADSTSLNKHPDSNSLATKYPEPIVREGEQVFQKKPVTLHSQIRTYDTTKKCLIADIYKPKGKATNIIFKGYCYFNIIGKCTFRIYKPCRFSHDIPDEKEVENKLSVLNEEMFIREYMLIRRNQHLMSRYGICFVEECAKRQLTGILVEMAYDFIMKGSLIDETIKVNAVEITLMHLNGVDLSECENLLKMRVCGETLLCEVFMKVMASSQNFSRFKSVFLSLTYLLIHNDRTFNLDVAEQILERVCILPFDEPVVRALIQIMRWTNPVIFLNSMIVKFEKQISINSDILSEYVSVKKDINFGNIGRRVDIVPMVIPIEQKLYQSVAAPLLVRSEQPQSEIREGVPLPPSPDTTHLDIMNKTVEEKTEPKIIRTISGVSAKPNSYIGFSPSPSHSEESIPNPNHISWRNSSIFHKIDQLSRQQMKILKPEQRLVTLRGKKYPHRGAKY